MCVWASKPPVFLKLFHRTLLKGLEGEKVMEGSGEMRGQHQGQTFDTTCDTQSSQSYGWTEHTILLKQQRNRTHRLNRPVQHTTHFTLHRKLCVLGVALRTKVSSQRQIWTTAAIQVTRRHSGRGTPWRIFPLVFPLLTSCVLLTPYWMKVWHPGLWGRQRCAEENLSRHRTSQSFYRIMLLPLSEL